MAGEKTSQKKKIVKKDEEYISMTKDQFQSLVSESIKAAMGQTESVPKEQKQDISKNIQHSLSTRINERNKRGERFNVELSDPNGPRKRIRIDKIYKEFAGNEITATVNGNTVKVPIDGDSHLVHPAHYAAIKEKLNYLSNTRDRAAEGPDMFGREEGDYQKVEK